MKSILFERARNIVKRRPGDVAFLALFFAAAYFLFPNRPHLPNENDIHKTIGLVSIKKYGGFKGTVEEVVIGEDAVHCSDDVVGRASCVMLIDKRVNLERPVIAYWFYTGRLLSNHRLLDRLEQDGKVIVSADLTYSIRVRQAETAMKYSYPMMLILFFGVFLASIFLPKSKRNAGSES